MNNGWDWDMEAVWMLGKMMEKPDRIEFIQGLFSELDEGGDCSQIREDLSCQIQLWRQQASEDSYPPI